MSHGGEPCGVCGAPHTPGYAACKFCKTLFVTDPSTPAVPCPKCATPNEWGAQKCVQCHSWVVVKCVFCNALSPHNVQACVQCREIFAGAPERLQQRQQAASRQQTMQIVGQVGTVAASFLGAVAGAAVSNHSSWGGGGQQRNGDGYPRENGGGGYGRDDGYQPNQGPGLMEQVFDSSSGASSDYGSTAPSGDAGGGGGILSELFGSSGDSSSSASSSDSGGGMLDALMGDSGSSSDDDR